MERRISCSGRAEFRQKFFKALEIFICVLPALLGGTACVGQTDVPPRHQFPRVGEYEVLVGDFHMHTVNSDGALTTRERVQESYRMGYDVVAITDHGTTRAFRVANYVGRQLGLIVIRGLETGVAGNEHMNAIGVSDTYIPVNPHGWSKRPGEESIYYRDAMKQVADSGGFLIYNHPHCGYHELVHWGIKQGILIGIEVRNDVCKEKLGATLHDGAYCYPEAFDFALANNLAVFANTDAHGPRIENPARTLVLVKERTAQGVLEAIRARRTAAWFQGRLWGRQALLSDLIVACVGVAAAGEKLVFENNCPITLRGKIDGASSIYFDLPAYERAAVDGAGCAGSVSVLWENVWTDPRTNLTTTHKLRRQGFIPTGAVAGSAAAE